MSGLEDELREMNRKLEIMMGRLDYLEAALIESRQYPELTQIMGDLKVGASLYTEPLKLIERLVRIKRQLARDEEYRDEISRMIPNVLALRGPRNISALTREVQKERGSGSRVTVRKKVLELVDEGIIEKGEGYDYRLKE
ncbi:hypothetical protein GF319_00015 [Candidatus Bathyarchaeota archaeon]|nr:hypothetical protein [Candidatus Bathyarchaeota archaeon]